jgi:hypothetical protein
MGTSYRRLGVAAVAVSLALATGAAAAEEAKPAEKGPNTGAVSVLMGMDWTTDYYFRGILQSDEGWILQPYGEITFKLLENMGALNTLGLSIGSWNSLHGGPSGIEGGSASVDPKMWYESDFYVRVGSTIFEDVSTAIIYTAYMSPNDRFQTVQELAVSAAYNDSKLLGAFALNPNALLAFEVKGQADAGAHRGVYLQFGIAPGLTVLDKTDYPIALSVPLNFAFSLSNYYEFDTGDDDGFGWWSVGLNAAMPLKFIPPRFGSWQVKGSFTMLRLEGDNLRAVNNNDSPEFIAALGRAFTY